MTASTAPSAQGSVAEPALVAAFAMKKALAHGRQFNPRSLVSTRIGPRADSEQCFAM
jgi:hypothetical protein